MDTQSGVQCAVASLIPGTLRNYATGRFTKYPWVKLTPTTGVAFEFNRRKREIAIPPAGQTEEQHVLCLPYQVRAKRNTPSTT